MSEISATIMDFQDGRVICEDGYGDWWFTEIPSQYVNPGEAIPLRDLRRIEVLSEQEQQAIRERMSQLSEEYLAFLREGLV